LEIERALDSTLWRTRFGRDYGPVVRQTTEGVNELMKPGGTVPKVSLGYRGLMKLKKS